jgi:LPXTG-motif cell wall-anchored protein
LKPNLWLGLIILYTALTLAAVYLIPSDSILSWLTYFLGFTFVAVMPGYCLINVLFKEGKLELIETAVLSVALSFSLVGVLGLFLGLSPIGIATNSITITLSGIVLILAILSFLRKRQK